ncbi:endonuclease domain-containing 1 protein-like [Astyanax mexicanus]|uniref:endonuclease domain-containing 1 protein-like n=1 Tax=Astyanax mexicanus TaxID=7994 RepID=UPI0020CB0BD5|nr:endonuclease domain-containing 1 protein-like [Astyanax mexicanus]
MTLLMPVLLLLALSGCFSEVVKDFTQSCPQFFADPEEVRSPPTIFKDPQYKHICQIRENKYEYATLYDTANRIPVYSAYKFQGLIDCTQRNKRWFIEPQLDDPNSNKKKMESDGNKDQLPKQAVNKDYEGTQDHHYDKGHLAPVRHASSTVCLDATFTLTNAAPQNRNFNRGIWSNTERNVANILTQECKNNDRYIVTGVVPGTDKLKERVSIPSHFWTAYCCLDNNRKVIASGAFIGRNEHSSTVEEMSVTELDRKLTVEYSKGEFTVFGGKCNKPDSNRFKVVHSNKRLQNIYERYRKERQRKRLVGKANAPKIYFCGRKHE